MRVSEIVKTLVCSTDSDLLRLLSDLEIDFENIDHNENNVHQKFYLIVDLDGLGIEESTTLIKNNYDCQNILVVSSESLSLEYRIKLANVGVDSIAEKDNLLLELSEFIKRPSEKGSARIILIDDSETDLFVISEALSSGEFDIRQFNEAQLALEQIDEIQPDLIMVDIHMPPPLNGPSFVRVLRQMPKYASLPVVFVSGENNEATKISALESGADDILTKPISSELSSRILNKHIKRSRQQLDQINRDPLTKAYNRNFLGAVKDRFVSSGNPFLVAILDIDFFKKLNDEFGHDFGDQALKHMSGLLQRQVRSQDYVFRFGGEEFVLIIDTDDLKIGYEIIERLRRQLETSLILNGEQAVKMTFSAGASMCDNKQFDDALKHADELLYFAKESGRNRTLIKM